MAKYSMREFCMSDLQEMIPVAEPQLGGTFLPGRAFTFSVNGEVCLCAGIRELWAHVGEVWAIVSSTHPPGPRLLREVREFVLQGVSRELDLKVLVAFVPEGFTPGQRFAEFFGFQEQARIPGFYYPNAGIVYVKEWVWEQK